MKEHYDVAIMGAGVGGLVTGAILAAKEKMNVIVLEKNRVIGGRVVSFGKQHGSDYSGSEVRELLAKCAFTTVIKSEPDFDQIIAKGVLKDFIIDCGWHGTGGGQRSRLGLIGRALGKPIPFSDGLGTAFLEDERWLQLTELTKEWPAESITERSRVAYERQLLSAEQASKYDQVDLASYLESVTDDKLVRDYYCDLARWELGINSCSRISAGEWIKVNNGVAAAGRHLVHGGGIGEVTGGYKTIADILASVIQENGGEVRTEHPVTEVIIKNWKAEGVVVKGKTGNEEIKASNVVCNPPPYHLPGIIPDKYFVGELMQRVKNMYSTGAVCGHLCLKEPLEKDYWPKGQFVVRRNPEGRDLLLDTGGVPAVGFEQTSIVDPSRAPEGRYLVQFCDIVDPEALQPGHPTLQQQADVMIRFFRNHYPHFDDILEWYFITDSPLGSGLAPVIGICGDRRFPIRHPLIPNLFFTGDCVEQWDTFTSGAAHGGVLCASAVADRDYLSLLPPYWR